LEHEHETPELDQEFDPVFEEEQQHLTETYAKLQTMGRDLLAKMEANSKDAAADKLAMVDELSVNLASYADAMETYADFATVNRVIDAYNLAQTVDAEKLTSIQVLLKQPYFAKVVLQMKPGQEPKELYIGTAGIADENYRRLVVDWRSPVAEVYYNQENGPTSYEANGRTIRVDLKLRRQFDIEADRLNAYFDTTLLGPGGRHPRRHAAGVAVEAPHGADAGHHRHHPERAEPGHPPRGRAHLAGERHRRQREDVGAHAAHRVSVLPAAREPRSQRGVPHHAEPGVRALH